MYVLLTDEYLTLHTHLLTYSLSYTHTLSSARTHVMVYSHYLFLACALAHTISLSRTLSLTLYIFRARSCSRHRALARALTRTLSRTRVYNSHVPCQQVGDVLIQVLTKAEQGLRLCTP